MEMEMERRIKNLPNISRSENTVEIDQVLTVFFLAVYFTLLVLGCLPLPFCLVGLELFFFGRKPKRKGETP